MLYELVFYMTYFGQQCVNRFNYVSSGSSGAFSGSLGLMNAIGALDDQTPPVSNTLMGDLLNAMSSSVTMDAVSIRAIYDVEDFVEQVYSTPVVGGDTSATPTSPAIAYSLVSNRVRQDIRRGQKRLVGVSEELIEDGGIVSAGQIAVLINLAETMADTLDYTASGDTITYVPAIVGKEKYVAPSGRDAYRYYATLAAQTAHLALSPVWSVRPYVSTQRSRQYGHGR